MPRIMKIFGRKQAGPATEALPPVSPSSDPPVDNVKADTPTFTPPPSSALSDEDLFGSEEDDDDDGALKSSTQSGGPVRDSAPAAEPARALDAPDVGSEPAAPPAAPSMADAPMSLHVDAHPVEEIPAPQVQAEPHAISPTPPFAARTTSALPTKIEEAAPDPEPVPMTRQPSPPPAPDEAPVSSIYRGRVDEPVSPDEASPIAPSKTLIGGEEADIVPLIPDTKAEVESQDLDDEAVAGATVEALRGACDLMVSRVNKVVTLHDGGQVITAMTALVAELDARYAEDWGVVRRNGVQEVLDQVYASIAEGDRFILESLENGRGGLTAEEFVRDLRTVAESDRPRIVTAYSNFLVFVIRCVLRQYLRPLDNDQMRLRDVSRRLDYLVDGVREVLSDRIHGGMRAN